MNANIEKAPSHSLATRNPAIREIAPERGPYPARRISRGQAVDWLSLWVHRRNSKNNRENADSSCFSALPQSIDNNVARRVNVVRLGPGALQAGEGNWLPIASAGPGQKAFARSRHAYGGTSAPSSATSEGRSYSRTVCRWLSGRKKRPRCNSSDASDGFDEHQPLTALLIVSSSSMRVGIAKPYISTLTLRLASKIGIAVRSATPRKKEEEAEGRVSIAMPYHATARSRDGGRNVGWRLGCDINAAQSCERCWLTCTLKGKQANIPANGFTPARDQALPRISTPG